MELRVEDGLYVLDLEGATVNVKLPKEHPYISIAMGNLGRIVRGHFIADPESNHVIAESNHAGV